MMVTDANVSDNIYFGTYPGLIDCNYNILCSLDIRSHNARHPKESIIEQKILNRICPCFYTKLAENAPNFCRR